MPAASCTTDHWMSGAVWLGGEALANHLLTSPALVRGARVLELGGGTGIVGLTAALAGAAEVTITDQQLDQASKNLEANPLLRTRVKLEKLLWGPSAAPYAVHTDVVVGADLVSSIDAPTLCAFEPYPTANKNGRVCHTQVYPMNVDESLQVLLVTLQVLGRPTLLAYVERSEAVTHALESGLRSLRRHRCRQLRLGSKTIIYALDAWARDHRSDDSSLGHGPYLGCSEVQSLSSWFP